MLGLSKIKISTLSLAVQRKSALEVNSICLSSTCKSEATKLKQATICTSNGKSGSLRSHSVKPIHYRGEIKIKKNTNSPLLERLKVLLELRGAQHHIDEHVTRGHRGQQAKLEHQTQPQEHRDRGQAQHRTSDVRLGRKNAFYSKG